MNFRNAVLSFGRIGDNASWSHGSNRSTAPERDDSQDHKSLPSAKVHLATKRNGELSVYGVDWALDPVSLANSMSRGNVAITPTARLPKILRLAILYDIKDLPFEDGNFSFVDSGQLMG